MSRTIFTNGKVFDGENASRDGVRYAARAGPAPGK